MTSFLRGIEEAVGVVPSHLGDLGGDLAVRDRKEAVGLNLSLGLEALAKLGNDCSFIDLEFAVWKFFS